MRLPTPLLRRNKRAHKNDFGHVLIVAGSPAMLGAAALTGLAAMRAGAGMTTIAVARSLNRTLQAKIANVIMTRPLPESRKGTIAFGAFDVLKRDWSKYSAVALGPGMTTDPGTVTFIEKMYRECPLPMVVDADALNALALPASSFQSQRAGEPEAHLNARILTPHPGEFFRLTGLKPRTDRERLRAAKAFAVKHQVVIVLKGYHTVVASPDGKAYVNHTGNPGMATAGCGDVLTGMIAALLAQGLTAFEAARGGVFLHGKSGDRAAGKCMKFSLIATDLFDAL